MLYCGDACQRSAWPGHSAACKISQAKYKPVDLVSNPAGAGSVGVYLNYKSKKVHSCQNSGQPGKNNFVVKIQVPVEDGSGFAEAGHGEFMIYNKDRSVMGFLKREGHEDIYDILNTDIRNKGSNGAKAFYYATFREIKKGNGTVIGVWDK